jgi:hypothetical protein
MKYNIEKQRMVDIRVESCHLPNPARVAWQQASANHAQYRAKPTSAASAAPSTPVKKERKFTLPLRQSSSDPATPTRTVAESTTSGTIVLDADSVDDSVSPSPPRRPSSKVPVKMSEKDVAAKKAKATKAAKQRAENDSAESEQSVQEYELLQSEEDSDAEVNEKKKTSSKRKREPAAAEEEEEETEEPEEAQPKTRRNKSATVKRKNPTSGDDDSTSYSSLQSNPTAADMSLPNFASLMAAGKKAVDDAAAYKVPKKAEIKEMNAEAAANAKAMRKFEKLVSNTSKERAHAENACCVFRS